MAKKPAKTQKRSSGPSARARRAGRKSARAAAASRSAARGRSARKTAKKSAKKAAAKKVTRKVVRKAATRVKRAAPKKAAAKRVAVKAKAPAKAAASKKAPAMKTAVKAPKAAPKVAAKTAAKAAVPPRKAPALDRERRTVREPHSTPSSLVPAGHASAASSGADELRVKLASHPGGAEIAAGDLDANWESAETVGDEAPGGDNPTPDQDVVDEIGRALGVEYDDDEELQGGDEIAGRDRHRWELDPGSSDDFDER